MFEGSTVRWTSDRALPLRSVQFSPQGSGALALPTQIWFTPEVIIWDAIGVVNDLLWLWRYFSRLVSVLAGRVVIIFGLIFFFVTIVASPPATAVVVGGRATPSVPEINTAVIARDAEEFTYQWPIAKTYISSGFSRFHKGIDLPTKYGTPVRPFLPGKVVFAGWDGGFGHTVVLEHQGGFSSRYSHLSAINVVLGTLVGTNSVIGKVGRSGFATGSHLHFEIYQGGTAINPLNFLP